MSKLNIPNALTLLRVLLVAPLILMLASGRKITAMIIYGTLLLTDILDGYLARRLKQVSDFGEYFDFVADFIVYYSLILYFVIIGRLHIVNTVLIIIATIALLWIAITLSKKTGRPYMPHRTSSKVMAVLLCSALAYFIVGLRYENLIMFLVLITIFLYTLVDYIRYTVKYRKWEVWNLAKKGIWDIIEIPVYVLLAWGIIGWLLTVYEVMNTFVISGLGWVIMLGAFGYIGSRTRCSQRHGHDLNQDRSLCWDCDSTRNISSYRCGYCIGLKTGT